MRLSQDLALISIEISLHEKLEVLKTVIVLRQKVVKLTDLLIHHVVFIREDLSLRLLLTLVLVELVH